MNLDNKSNEPRSQTKLWWAIKLFEPFFSWLFLFSASLLAYGYRPEGRIDASGIIRLPGNLRGDCPQAEE